MRRSVSSNLFAGLIAALGVACGENTASVCDVPGACADTDSGLDGQPPIDAPGPDAADASPGCDLTREPKDSTACVADSVGVFVSTMGDDTNPGTRTKPVRTIAAGLGKLNGLTRLYVCAGPYPEDVILDSGHDGTSIYGGWKCSDWTYDASSVPTIGKGTLALKVDGVSKPMVLSDLAFISADATTRVAR